MGASDLNEKLQSLNWLAFSIRSLVTMNFLLPPKTQTTQLCLVFTQQRVDCNYEAVWLGECGGSIGIIHTGFGLM